ncbi:hypothetical protein ScalyP_jg2344 [Parmales sp. scaly parma]|nr:hypothetical protein ScalyP_jg2344 [Parmales sp. scaly parma]
MHLEALLLVLLQFKVKLATSFGNSDSDHSRSSHATDPRIFYVHINQNPKNPKPLGVHLSNELVVQSFSHQNTKNAPLPWIYSEAGVREGDKIEQVDGVTYHTLQDALHHIRIAQVLTFRERAGDLGSERDLLVHETAAQAQRRYEFNDGHLDLMDRHLVLSSHMVTTAQFTGKTHDCFPRKIIFATPSEYCGIIQEDDLNISDDYMENAYVVVARGGCSFAQKCLNVAERNGAGVIVVNNADKRLVMPTDPQLLSKNMKIPVVMISARDGMELSKAHDSHHRGLHGRLAISRQCLGEDARFHKRYMEEYEKDVIEEKHQKALLKRQQEKVTDSKGVRVRLTKPKIGHGGTDEHWGVDVDLDVEGGDDESIYRLDVNAGGGGYSGGDEDEDEDEDEEGGRSDYGVDQFQPATERERIAFEDVARRRKSQGISGGEIALSGGKIEVEFLALDAKKFAQGIDSLGGYFDLFNEEDSQLKQIITLEDRATRGWLKEEDEAAEVGHRHYKYKHVVNKKSIVIFRNEGKGKGGPRPWG